MNPATASAHGTRFRWVVVALLFLITVFNYVDRTAISYAVPIISREFGFDDRTVGLILGAFGIGYFVTTLIGGVSVDRFGSRRVLLIAALVWSAAIGGTALAIGAVSLFLARVLLGLAEGPNFPAMSRAIGDWLPPEERATALARSLVAIPLALAASAPIVTALLAWVGWRAMFAILAAAVLLWIPLWIWLYRDNPARSPHVDAAELEHIGAARSAARERGGAPALDWAALRAVLANRTLFANAWAFFVLGYFLFFFMSWLPDYLEKVFHLSLHAVGYFAFLPWFVAAACLWLFGSLSDRLLRRTGRLRIARSRLIMLTQAGAALAVMPIAYAGNADLAIVLITLAVGLAMSANAVYFAVTIDVAPRYAGTALGVMDAALALAGVLAPSITGYIVAITGTFAAAFWVLAMLAASSVMLVYLLHHPDEDRIRDACVTDA